MNTRPVRAVLDQFEHNQVAFMPVQARGQCRHVHNGYMLGQAFQVCQRGWFFACNNQGSGLGVQGLQRFDDFKNILFRTTNRQEGQKQDICKCPVLNNFTRFVI